MCYVYDPPPDPNEPRPDWPGRIVTFAACVFILTFACGVWR